MTQSGSCLFERKNCDSGKIKIRRKTLSPYLTFCGNPRFNERNFSAQVKLFRGSIRKTQTYSRFDQKRVRNWRISL